MTPVNSRLPSEALRPFEAAPFSLSGRQAAAQQYQHLLRRPQHSAAPKPPLAQHVCRCQAAQQPLPDDRSSTRAQQQDEEDSDSMAQYLQLKADMNRTTRRFAAFLSGYLLLTTTSDVSASVSTALSTCTVHGLCLT
jgi:hypothetical protein